MEGNRKLLMVVIVAVVAVAGIVLVAIFQKDVLTEVIAAVSGLSALILGGGIAGNLSEHKIKLQGRPPAQ